MMCGDCGFNGHNKFPGCRVNAQRKYEYLKAQGGVVVGIDILTKEGSIAHIDPWGKVTWKPNALEGEGVSYECDGSSIGRGVPQNGGRTRRESFKTDG